MHRFLGTHYYINFVALYWGAHRRFLLCEVNIMLDMKRRVQSPNGSVGRLHWSLLLSSIFRLEFFFSSTALLQLLLSVAYVSQLTGTISVQSNVFFKLILESTTWGSSRTQDASSKKRFCSGIRNLGKVSGPSNSAATHDSFEGLHLYFYLFKTCLITFNSENNLDTKIGHYFPDNQFFLYIYMKSP